MGDSLQMQCSIQGLRLSYRLPLLLLLLLLLDCELLDCELNLGSE
jgi:hypothetical protein